MKEGEQKKYENYFKDGRAFWIDDDDDDKRKINRLRGFFRDR